jgi:hypothetical protein
MAKKVEIAALGGEPSEGQQVVHSEVVVKSGRTYLIGEQRLEIRDSSLPAAHVDIITKCDVIGQTFHLNLAAIISDDGNPAYLDVVARLRMDAVTVQNLHTFLGRVIAQYQQSPDKTQVN